MQEKILIIDDLFVKEETKKIKEFILNEEFPWHLYSSTVGEYTDTWDSKTFEYVQFCHQFLIDDINGKTKINSNYFFIVEYIIKKVQQRLKKEFLVYRAKANLQTKVQTNLIHNTSHTDFKEKINYMSMIYYVNDSDGKTYIFKDKKNSNGDWEIDTEIPAKEGRVLIFDGVKNHSGSHPKNGIRAVINFVLKYEEIF
jgi:hypothetical protein